MVFNSVMLARNGSTPPPVVRQTFEIFGEHSDPQNRETLTYIPAQLDLFSMSRLCTDRIQGISMLHLAVSRLSLIGRSAEGCRKCTLEFSKTDLAEIHNWNVVC